MPQRNQQTTQASPPPSAGKDDEIMIEYVAGQEIVAGVKAPEAFTSRGGANGGMLISGSISQTNSFCEKMGSRHGAFRVIGKNGTGVIRWKVTGGGGGVRFEVTQ